VNPADRRRPVVSGLYHQAAAADQLTTVFPPPYHLHGGLGSEGCGDDFLCDGSFYFPSWVDPVGFLVLVRRTVEIGILVEAADKCGRGGGDGGRGGQFVRGRIRHRPEKMNFRSGKPVDQHGPSTGGARCEAVLCCDPSARVKFPPAGTKAANTGKSPACAK